jgi:hypothetical protein
MGAEIHNEIDIIKPIEDDIKKKRREYYKEYYHKNEEQREKKKAYSRNYSKQNYVKSILAGKTGSKKIGLLQRKTEKIKRELGELEKRANAFREKLKLEKNIDIIK